MNHGICAALPAYAAKVSEMEHFNLDSVQGNVKVHKIYHPSTPQYHLCQG